MKLEDFFTLNDAHYDQLPDSEKASIDKFVHKIREYGLEEQLLQRITSDYNYDIERSKTGHYFRTNLPPDLQKGLDRAWIHKDDQ